jgi:hypothetical protein
MAAPEFRTVPDELLGIAGAAAKWLKDCGHKVTPEYRETGYPFTPTLYGKAHLATAFVEVDAEIAIGRMEEWVAYGRSCRSETRVWCAIPDSAPRSGKQDLQLKGLGIGLLLVGDGRAVETIPAKDLAVSVELPAIDALPPRIQKVLGPVYLHFDHAEWREGFRDACLALEEAARKHLWKGIKTGRIAIVSKSGKQEQFTKGKVDHFTMGQLADRFSRIVQQTHTDRVIGDVLKQVNPNRVGVTHHKGKAAVEAKLRRDVGSQMWLIVGALKEIDGSP